MEDLEFEKKDTNKHVSKMQRIVTSGTFEIAKHFWTFRPPKVSYLFPLLNLS